MLAKQSEDHKAAIAKCKADTADALKVQADLREENSNAYSDLYWEWSQNKRNGDALKLCQEDRLDREREIQELKLAFFPTDHPIGGDLPVVENPERTLNFEGSPATVRSFNIRLSRRVRKDPGSKCTMFDCIEARTFARNSIEQLELIVSRLRTLHQISLASTNVLKELYKTIPNLREKHQQATNPLRSAALDSAMIAITDEFEQCLSKPFVTVSASCMDEIFRDKLKRGGCKTSQKLSLVMVGLWAQQAIKTEVTID